MRFHIDFLGDFFFKEMPPFFILENNDEFHLQKTGENYLYFHGSKSLKSILFAFLFEKKHPKVPIIKENFICPEYSFGVLEAQKGPFFADIYLFKTHEFISIQGSPQDGGLDWLWALFSFILEQKNLSLHYSNSYKKINNYLWSIAFPEKS